MLVYFAAVLSLSIQSLSIQGTTGKALHPSRASPSITCLAGFGAKPDAAASTPKKGGAKSKPAKVVSKAKVADPQLEEGRRRQTITSTRSVRVDLGKGKSVSVILPTLDDEDDEATLASMSIESIAAK